MEWPMKLVRELRELDADYEWMKLNRAESIIDSDVYFKLCDEYRRLRISMLNELAEHMESR